jgi:CDP-glucose 4,6-dehydratase
MGFLRGKKVIAFPVIHYFMQKILDLMDNKDLEPIILNQAKNEIKHQYLSAKKAREILNWKPKYSVDECLQETIKWYQDFLRDRLN